MERPKRVISKPPRYLTTSSDKAPKRKRVVALGDTMAEEMEEDINELRTTLKEDTAMDKNNTHIPSNKELLTQKQYLPQTHKHKDTHTTHTHTHTTYTPTYTNLDTYRSHNTCASDNEMACTSVVSSYPYAHNYISHTLSETFNNPTFTEFQSNTEQFQSGRPHRAAYILINRMQSKTQFTIADVLKIQCK